MNETTEHIISIALELDECMTVHYYQKVVNLSAVFFGLSSSFLL